MNLRLCHSYWTAPSERQRWGIENQIVSNVCLAAVSVAFAKKIGATIALHTDLNGKEFLGWLPYNELHLSLEQHNFHSAFWASGKILAQEREPLGSIHIDLDVFIKRPFKLVLENISVYNK
jgi:hypothetical protein